MPYAIVVNQALTYNLRIKSFVNAILRFLGGFEKLTKRT